MRKSLITMVVLLFCATQWSFGQTSNQGAVVGRVTDPNGGVVPAVQVVVRNVETGISRNVVTNDNGDYRVDFLPPGRYAISAETEGFSKAEVPEVVVHVSEVQRIDLQLSIGGVREEITVSSEGGSAINTENPTMGEVVGERSIQNLPLNGREFIDLAGLVPGAETGNDKRGAVASKGLAVGFSGARSGYNAYYVDGADSTDANENQLISSPALDAIKEFRVETSLYSARYGRAGGGVVNVVTKSGTNQFHGTLYEYHRNKVLDALPFGYIGSKEDQPNYLFNQFGGTVGGPIIKQKTFFFFSAEYFRQIKPGTLMETFAPTAKERAGDFSESINPYTGLPVVLRNPFTGEVIPGNKIPTELMNPVGQKLMDLWPEPNYSGDPIMNLRQLRSGTYNQNKYLVKIDHNFSDQSTLSGSFNYGKYDNITPGNTEFSDTNGFQYDKSLVLTYTRTLTQSLVNDIKFNYTWFNSGTSLAMSDKNYAQEFGFWTGQEKPDAMGFPRVLMYTVNNRLFQIGGPGPNQRDNRNIYIKDDLVWVKGTHSVSIGGDFKQQNVDWLISNAPLGAYYFGINDGLPSQAATYQATGSTFASVLMGVTARTTFDTNDGRSSKMRRNMFALYVQDDWKVTPRLTLNLGLRYDYEAPFSSVDGKYMTLNFETGLPRYSEGAPVDRLEGIQYPYETGGPSRPYEPSKFNFAPRFGFAFRPFNDNKTSIRGGYGMVYNSETFYTTAYGAFVVPFSGQFDYYPRYHVTRSPWPDKQAHFVPIDQEPYRLDLIAGKSPGTFLPTTPYYPSGNVQHFNLSVSREVMGVALEAAYVGSKGTNLNGVSSLAVEDPELNKKVLANIPAWTIGLRTKGFNSKYHAFQAKANKRFSRGLSFLASFTWSHAMAEASNDAVNENSVSDTDELGTLLVSRQWSNADFDVRRRFSLSGRYELPFGRTRTFGKNWNGFADAVLGGWSLNFILTMQDGRPYSVRSANGRVPDRICDGNLPASERTDDVWFDYKCFVDHPSQTVTGPDGVKRTISLQGNAGPNIITGPGIKNVDLGLHKEFQFTESVKLQLRAEAFNVFNRLNLIGPTNNFFGTTVNTANIARARDRRDLQIAVKLIF